MSKVIAGLEAATWQPHALHGAARDWPQTNCHTDLWIEVLHALGLPPQAALGFTVTQDFEGDQFTFFKFPPEDLESLFGIVVQELAIYESVEAHVTEQIARGRLALAEVDGFFLPDTAGASYRTEHTKTTVGVNRLDVAGHAMDYFHNDGLFSLSGADFDGIFASASGPLFPYVEFAKFPARYDPGGFHAKSCGLMQRHLSRLPARNPVAAWQEEFPAQIKALAMRDPAHFHKYAFNTARQTGANFGLLAAHLDWLTAGGETGLEGARDAALAFSSTAKSLQFQMARAVNRKKFDGLETLLGPLAGHWDACIGALRARLPG